MVITKTNAVLHIKNERKANCNPLPPPPKENLCFGEGQKPPKYMLQISFHILYLYLYYS